MQIFNKPLIYVPSLPDFLSVLQSSHENEFFVSLEPQLML